MVFNFIDLIIGPLPFVRGGEAFHPFHQHPAVPAAIHDQGLSVFGQPGHEPVHIVVAEILLGWG